MPKAKTTPKEKLITGYLYRNTESEFNECVCQLVSRVKESGTLMEQGPSFKVKFGDGTEKVVSGYELSPWFAT